METGYFKIKVILILMIILPGWVYAQQKSTVKEYEKSYTTYPFSEPDPVANPTNVYPYFRFDGFTDKPVQKKWKVVELENDFIKVMILPQIGGKIWTAIDKKNGKPFIYDNDVVKFRDIAMRGAWTSGGIEINYGMFGHTPGVATPVNYITKENPDGSASCILSLLDLLTRTRWSLEVRLPKDKAYFITKSFWHNGTAIYQPYYTWMNMAQKVSDSLEYIFPGSHYIGHDGSVHEWPVDKQNGKNLSFYNQNNFGGSKSYHVTGAYSKYFGVYWQKEDFGMIHYAPRQDKIGKKIFIWGLARSGMIWEDILTDHAGQYTEMQSGRLYNQNAPGSVFSPFKQFHFMPYSTDTWSEYWYPFKNTDGVTKADLNSVINIEQKGGEATIFISPVSYINDTLKVMDTNGNVLYSRPVKLEPLESFRQNVNLERGDAIGKITLAGSEVNLQNSDAKVLDRPLKPDSDFDWKSAYGLYLRGEYEAGTRHYDSAVKYIRASLIKQPYLMPALTAISYLEYRQMNYDSAFYYARKALSIDTYDPAANYYYGLAALKLNKESDALDGFQVAAITSQFRSAAYTELSKMKIQNHKFTEAYKDASEALVNNTKNITALKLLYLAAHLMDSIKEKNDIKKNIMELDPSNNFIRFEEYWQNKSEVSKEKFTNLIQDELPQQTYLHLAGWYMDLGLHAEAEAVLQASPTKDDEIKYWLAYLHRDDIEGKKWLDSANVGSPLFVFPFRSESFHIMQWAMKQTNNWRPCYYLALIEAFRNHKAPALKLLEELGSTIDFAPLYVTRARLRNSSDTDNILHDYTTAASLDKKDWRYGKYLAEFLLSQKQNAQALKVIQPYYKKDPENYITGMLYTRCLLLNEDYEMAEKILDHIHILPFEGATNGHALYEQTKLMLAIQLLQKKKYKGALQKVDDARKWPERLGVGEPYPNRINESLENELQKLIERARQGHKPSEDEITAITLKVKGGD